MKAILAALTLTDVVLAPAQVFGTHVVTLIKDGVPGDPVQTTEDSVSFEDLEPGTYTATAVSLDSTGTPLAPVVTSAEFVIEPDAPTTAKAVNGITLSLAPPVV